MEPLEALLTGVLSSTDNPEIRVRRLRDNTYSARCYAQNVTKTGHGKGATVGEAIADMTTKRGGRGTKV